MSELDELEKARAEFARVQPLYDRLAQEVADILKTKLAGANLKPVSITHRPKDIDSFAEKSRARTTQTRWRK